jgi:UDP-GlcNAc:undecaprenyl-phosphate GlcNAc-1-phosphate transferase
VPLFDTAFVSVLRLSRGQSPFRGSPDHFAIRLRRWGWSVPRIVLAAGASGALCGIAGVLNLQLSSRSSLGLLAAAAVVAASVSAWLLRPAAGGAPA